MKLERIHASGVTAKLAFTTLVINCPLTNRLSASCDRSKEVGPSLCVRTIVFPLHGHLTAACSTIELSRNLCLKEQCDSRMLRSDTESGGPKSRPFLGRDSTIELSRNLCLKERCDNRVPPNLGLPFGPVRSHRRRDFSRQDVVLTGSTIAE
jgi:hypothetical protein